MDSFTFATSAKIIFGAGSASQLPELVQATGTRPFVVTGGKPERYASTIGRLENAAVFPIPHEPTMEIARTAVAKASEHGADVIIGLGGGAALDTAKIVAALLTNGGDPMDYAEVIGRGLPLTKTALPVIAIPTTSGTGSEVTANGVLTSTSHGVKVSLRSQSMLPKAALVDPELTLSAPPQVTAYSGLDALVQCIEPYVTPLSNPLTDALAKAGIERSARSLRRAYADGADIQARTDLSLTSLFSGLCLANAKLGAAHGIAGPAGGMLGAAHGAITAAVMPAVCRANLAAAKAGKTPTDTADRYAEVGEILTGIRDANAGIEWFAETAHLLGGKGLAELGLQAEQIKPLAEAAAGASSSKGNPVVLSVADFEEIIQHSL